ncbi:hypothetical protein ACHAW5_001957 [Stephanodiscus triporus]|uniref:Uncharacterized protein n=1 Tax=Stephanodiscus triporus TaxID=2934178 RepID=A0ABD3MZC0_9STRA
MIMATFSFLPLEYRPFHHQIIITHQTVKTKIAPSKQFLFLAFYYPWYVAGEKFWSQYGQDLRPLLGHYGSDQISVAERHIEMAVRGGIDSFVVTWTKRNSPRASNFLNATLKASNVDKIKFVMLYESLGALAGDGDFANGALDTFVEDMVFFKDTYFDHPSYLHINGRPVVYVYLTRYWKNFDTTMLHTINNKVGRNILIIADNPYFGNNISPHTSPYGIRDNSSVFEVYNSYNMYTFPNVRLGESAVDYMFRDALPIYQSWSKETVFFPSVLPKYHDFREGHKPLVGDVAGLMQQLQVFACLPRPVWYQNEFPNLMFITSFNEWWEGTSIEPDGEDKYGYKFLDAIKLFKDSEVVCQENQTNVSTLVLKA